MTRVVCVCVKRVQLCVLPTNVGHTMLIRFHNLDMAGNALSETMYTDLKHARVNVGNDGTVMMAREFK